MSQDPFETQSNNEGAWVGVRQGLHQDTNTPHTEFIIQDKENGDHAHLGIDQYGNEVFRTDR